jgi:hypothetical protein
LGKVIGEGVRNMKKFLRYLGVFVLFAVLVNFISLSDRHMKSLMGRTFDYLALGVSVQIIGSFLFGLFLGSLNFILEFKKDGHWNVNKERLFALGLPLFIILAMVNLSYMGMMWPQTIQKLLFYILTRNMIEYIAVFLGYIVISSLTKESEIK